MISKYIRNILFSLLVLGYIYYGWRYIQDSSFFVNGKVYYVFFDDVMIFMCYVYNLVYGLGFVWNVG